MPFTAMAGKNQHTLSAGQATGSTALYENIIFTSEQIMEDLYSVYPKYHPPNLYTEYKYLYKCHVGFVYQDTWHSLKGDAITTAL